MIRISVDFNRMADDQAVILPSWTPSEALVPGTRVILYEPDDIECEAIVRRDAAFPWVAEIVKGTMRDLVPGDDGKSGGTGPDAGKAT
jgi:hypothetical protein